MKSDLGQLNKRWTFWVSSPVTAILLPMTYIGGLFVLGIVIPAFPIAANSLIYLFGGLIAMAVLARIGISVGWGTVGREDSVPKLMSDLPLGTEAGRFAIGPCSCFCGGRIPCGGLACIHFF